MNLSDKAKDIIGWIVSILIAFILALLIRYFIGTPTIVQQPSMKPTLMPEQRLILNRWTRTARITPSRGDIITFEAPTSDSYTYDANNVMAKYSNEPKSIFRKFIYYVLEIDKASYIKRVIGLPGEHVKIQNGKVYINDEELSETYLQPDVTTPITSQQPFHDLVVPEKCLFVMGDNRQASTDSRSFGCIPLDKVESTVLIRFWPLNLFGGVD